MLLQILTASLTLILHLPGSTGGSTGEYLASPVPCLYNPVGNVVSAACGNDCTQEHGALNGSCNMNNVCACHYPGDNMAPLPTDVVPNPPLNPLGPDPIQQCMFDDRSLPFPIGTIGIFYGAYSAGCNLDCQCIHGALNGTCDFNTHLCHCNYPETATFANVNSYACLYCIPGEAAFVIGNHFNKTSLAYYNYIKTEIYPGPGVIGDLVLLPSTNFANGNCTNPE